MTNVVAFAGANLPAVSTLATALMSLKADVGSTGVILMKMDKTGHWVYGADQTEVEDDSLWAVNPFSFVHGYIAWGEGEVLAEKMVPVGSGMPELDSAPPGAKKGWEVQIGCSLKCISGEDEGIEVRYTTTSKGGKEALTALACAIAAQSESDPAKPVPVVSLSKTHYQHKQYGRIYTPVLKVIEWMSMTGESDKSEAPVAAVEDAAPAEEGGRRRRRA